MALASRIASWGALVKFSHSVFALPFAVIMMIVVARTHPLNIQTAALLIVCVVSARTAAMGFNRFIDREIDAKNPRTSAREIPRGVVGAGEALALTVGSSAVFLAGAALLGRHCFVLAPVVLALLLGYSLLKRYTTACHFVLGLALACAPGGVWYAMTGEWSMRPVVLMLGVLAWVAGFDILYSCQDLKFDQAQGLFSIPARLGLQRSRALALLLHLGALVALALFGVEFSLGSPYWIGLAIFGVVLLSQHVAVQRRGIECIDQVFFVRNGIASVELLAAVLVDSLVRAA